jgi:hypothetical protein
MRTREESHKSSNMQRKEERKEGKKKNGMQTEHLVVSQSVVVLKERRFRIVLIDFRLFGWLRNRKHTRDRDRQKKTKKKKIMMILSMKREKRDKRGRDETYERNFFGCRLAIEAQELCFLHVIIDILSKQTTKRKQMSRKRKKEEREKKEKERSRTADQ